MTESLENTEGTAIHWGAFALSLTAAPALAAAVIQLPLYATNLLVQSRDLQQPIDLLWGLIIIGAILYFLIGTPLLIWHLHHHAPRLGGIVKLALKSLLIMPLIGALSALVMSDPMPLLIAAISTVFGAIGAPPLAILFALIYARLCPPERT